MRALRGRKIAVEVKNDTISGCVSKAVLRFLKDTYAHVELGAPIIGPDSRCQDFSVIFGGMDPNAEPTRGQFGYLNANRIPFPNELTRGMAFDIIRRHKGRARANEEIKNVSTKP